jgi:hypothetical protein
MFPFPRSWRYRPATLILMFGIGAGHADEPVTARLSPETRALVIAEMQAIDDAMARIHSALVTGDHERIRREAQAIHDSFVLGQETTPQQRDEIRALPHAFIDADRAFHAVAARLAQAGDDHDPALERFWFQELTRACQSCHTNHASGRFPGLRGAAAPETEHHH